MAGPLWLRVSLAALMIAIAVGFAARLCLVRGRGLGLGRGSGTDGVHAAMGVAMAGMLVPGLSLLPDPVWEAAFVVSAAWFGWLIVRSAVSSQAKVPESALAPEPALVTAGGLVAEVGKLAVAQHDSPVPHLVECVAMVYMLAAAAAGGFGPPAIAVLLALCMVGAVVWRADGLVRTGPSGGLAPRLSVLGKIAMSATMGYMLFLMV